MNNFVTMLKENEISARVYNLTIGVMLFYGFLVNAIMCMFYTDVFLAWNPVAIIFGYFISAIVGIVMSKSDSPILSFIGYNLVVLPVGVVLSICLDEVYAGVILNAFIVTTVLTGFFIIAAVIYPEFFKKLGRMLFLSLLLLIVIEFIMMLIGAYTPGLIDWIACGIFCLYIGYDWAVAQSMPFTYNNAIDASLSLYLDIINLFIRLVNIASKKRD